MSSGILQIWSIWSIFEDIHIGTLNLKIRNLFLIISNPQQRVILEIVRCQCAMIKTHFGTDFN